MSKIPYINSLQFRSLLFLISYYFVTDAYTYSKQKDTLLVYEF